MKSVKTVSTSFNTVPGLSSDLKEKKASLEIKEKEKISQAGESKETALKQQCLGPILLVITIMTFKNRFKQKGSIFPTAHFRKRFQLIHMKYG